MKKVKNKATLQIGQVDITVKFDRCDLTITEMMDDVIYPLLWGVGYSQETLTNWLTKQCEELTGGI